VWFAGFSPFPTSQLHLCLCCICDGIQ
jgi:hypothetical protein